jgi:hypothetical protein
LRSPRGKAIRPAVAYLAAIGLAAGLTACSGSGEPNQFPTERAGEYEVEVTSATFPLRQKVAETYEMVLSVRNVGDEAVPDVNVSIELPERDSTLAFAYRTPQEGVAAPQRPVWVIEEGYPKLAGTVGRGGAATSSRRTFQFGTVAPGQSATMVWRLTAVQPGSQKVRWEIDAGLSPEVSAVDRSGATPEGLFEVRIANRPILTRVNRQGEVVPVGPGVERRVEIEEENSD